MSSTGIEDRTSLLEIRRQLRDYSDDDLARADKMLRGEIIPLEAPEIARLQLPGEIVSKPILSDNGRIAVIVKHVQNNFQTVFCTAPLGLHFATIQGGGAENIEFLQFADKCSTDERTDFPAFTFERKGCTHFRWGNWHVDQIVRHEDNEEVVGLKVVADGDLRYAAFMVHRPSEQDNYKVILLCQLCQHKGSEEYVFNTKNTSHPFECSQSRVVKAPKIIGIFGGIPCWYTDTHYDDSSHGLVYWGRRVSATLQNPREDTFWYHEDNLHFIAFHDGSSRTSKFVFSERYRPNTIHLSKNRCLVGQFNGVYFCAEHNCESREDSYTLCSDDPLDHTSQTLHHVEQLLCAPDGHVLVLESWNTGQGTEWRFHDYNPVWRPDWNEDSPALELNQPRNIRWMRMVGNHIMAVDVAGQIMEINRDPWGVSPPQPMHNIKLNDLKSVKNGTLIDMVLGVRSEGSRTISLLRFA
jgi:hypothetical protein